MILMNKTTVPADIEEYRKLNDEFNDITQWKIMTKMDEIQNNRRQKEERERLKRSMLEDQSKTGTKAIQQVVAAQGPFGGTRSRENESAIMAFD
jgi:hypothetical protein